MPTGRSQRIWTHTNATPGRNFRLSVKEKIADCPALGPVTPKVVNELLIVAWAWRMIAVAGHPRARTSVDGIFSPEYGLPARAPAMARAWANSLSSGREHGRSPHPHSSEQPLFPCPKKRHSA